MARTIRRRPSKAATPSVPLSPTHLRAEEFANRISNTIPFPTTVVEKAPPAPSTAAMKTAQAYVDPSRLISRNLFTPYNPSLLVSRKGLSIFDEMKRDEQVKSALAFKKSAVISAGWEVVSPGDEEDDWEVTRFVRDCFEQFAGGWQAVLQKMLRALDYGFSTCEKVFAEGTGAFEGKLVLDRLVELKPHYVDFVTDASGKVAAIEQMNVAGQTGDGRYHPSKFVCYVHDREFENAYGKSDLEAAYRPWWIKDNTYKWFAVMLERYGMAPLFALYDPNQYQGNTLEELKKVVRNIQNATMGIIPRTNGAEGLEFYSQNLAGSSKEIFLSAMGRFDSDIGKALLQPSMLGFVQESGAYGATSGGSMARSNISWRSFLMIIEEIQRDVASAGVNSQIIPQLCDLNFPGLKSYPLFRFLRLDNETEADLFRTWSELVAGKVVNRIEDDEQHIRKQLGFPPNDDPVLEALPGDAAMKAKAEADAKAEKEGGAFGPGEENEKPMPVDEKELSDEMRAFAEENAGVWYSVDGAFVCFAKESLA
jgi:phage gp29-like protein